MQQGWSCQSISAGHARREWIVDEISVESVPVTACLFPMPDMFILLFRFVLIMSVRHSRTTECFPQYSAGQAPFCP